MLGAKNQDVEGVSGWVKDSKQGSAAVRIVVVKAPYVWLFGLTFFEVRHFDKSVYPRQPARLKLRKGIDNERQRRNRRAHRKLMIKSKQKNIWTAGADGMKI
jgi:hypothetical protein